LIVLMFFFDIYNHSVETICDCIGSPKVTQVVAEKAVRSEPIEALRLAAELGPRAQRDELTREAARPRSAATMVSVRQRARGERHS
jgi:hypothetical protein